MTATVLLAGLVMSGWTAPDTTVALHRGDRVELHAFSGEVTVEAWDRPTLEITGEDREARNPTVTRDGSHVQVRPYLGRGRRGDVTLTVRVPAWVSLDIQGRELEVKVAGVSGGVSVRNVSGDIHVNRTGGDLDLNTVEGEIEVVDARGHVSAQSRGDDVSLTRVVGGVDVGTGNGNIRLQEVEAASVRAETLDGDVYFSGSLIHGGKYWFSTHDGDATLVVPRGSGAHVSVATFDGEFSSDFPVTLDHYTGEGRFDFTLGDGGAEVSLEVFDGEIRVRASGPGGARGQAVRGGSSSRSVPAGAGR